MDVVKRFGNRAIFEKNHGVRNANRYDVQERCTSKRNTVHCRPGKDPQSRSSMAQVRKNAGSMIGCIVRRISLDEIPLEVRRIFRQKVEGLGFVIGVVTGVEM